MPEIISNAAAAFLNLRRLPAALALLGRRPDHVPILVKAGLLKPLGDPAPNAVKQFAATEIEERAKDVKWLGNVQRHLSAHWANRNGKRGKPPEESGENPLA